MSNVSRFKKRDSDRSGFTFREISLVYDEGSLVGADEVDTPPPSNIPLGGEGDISPGFARSNFTSTETPSENQKVTRYITAVGGISYSDSESYLYICGSNDIIDVSANPQITRAEQNKLLTLQSVGSSIILEDGDGLSLRKVFVMDSGAILNLVYNATDSLWYETSRSHITKNLGEF